MKPHTSSSIPCHAEALVTVTYACGHCSGRPIRAGSLRWTKKNDLWDIAAFKVLDLAEEYRDRPKEGEAA